MYAVNIYVYRGRAYLPVQAIFESGIWVDMEPVFTSALNADELAAAVEEVIRAGHQTLPEPTREEWQQRKDPVLTATKARSWKALARDGAAYAIHKVDDEIRLDMSYTDKKGRWRFSNEKAKTFAAETPLTEIVNAILEDISSRPEVV